MLEAGRRTQKREGERRRQDAGKTKAPEGALFACADSIPGTATFLALRCVLVFLDIVFADLTVAIRLNVGTIAEVIGDIAAGVLNIVSNVAAGVFQVAKGIL